MKKKNRHVNEYKIKTNSKERSNVNTSDEKNHHPIQKL